MTPLLLLIPTVWLLIIVFVVALCRVAARADAASLAARTALAADRQAAHGEGSQVLAGQPHGEPRIHRAAVGGPGARVRGARCATRT